MKQHRDKLTSIILGTTLGVVLTLGGSVIIASEEDSNRIPLEDVQRFSTAINQIKNYYVKPVEDKDLFANAIKGMLEGLDPHSTYLDESDFKDIQASTKGEFGGIGIEVTMENGVIKVISPIDDTPAKKAGMQASDYIVRIDNSPVKGLTLREAVGKMRGKKETPLKLTVIRKGEKKPLTFTLVRKAIEIKSVKSELLEDNYGYVRISHFQALTARDMVAAIADLKRKAGGRLPGFILDLRNNPGGLLDAAIETSDAFIHNNTKGKEELIVYTQGRIPGSKFTAIAKPGDILESAPMVVLINGGSASGSEIVAGALKDNKRAILLGTKTFGKGSVQTILPLDDKRGIKLTTALYYTPAGTSIQAKGIQPDIQIDDVKIPQLEKTDNLMITEADLDGHIDNTQGPDAKKIKDKKANLLHKDYQLYAALNILKGLAFKQ